MTMGFNTELQGPSSHESLLKLQDTEIRLLEIIKKCVTQRVKCDREYAQSLLTITTIAGKFDNSENFSSPLFKAWTTVVKETETISKQLRSNADQIHSSTIEKLVELISEKRKTRKLYLDEKQRLEQEFNKLKDQVQKHRSDYEKSMNKLSLDKAKYDDAKAKSKTGKKLEDVKGKYKKSTDTVQRIHNDYVLQLHEANTHQKDYLRTTLPGLLDYLQESQESMIQQCKEVLHEYTTLTDSCGEHFSKSQGEISKAVGAINPSGEYDEFLNNCRSDPVDSVKFDFDDSLHGDTEVTLEPDALAVSDTTEVLLKQQVDQYNIEVKVVADKLEEKKESLQKCEEELNDLPPNNTMDDSDKNRFYTLKNTSQKLRKEIAELQCKEQKYKTLQEVITMAMSKFDGSAPRASVFPDDVSNSGSETSSRNVSRDDPGTSNLTTLETHAQAAKDKFHSIKKSLADKFKKQPNENPPEPPRKDFLDTSSQENSAVTNKPLPNIPQAAAEIAAKKKSDNIANDGSVGGNVKSRIHKYEQCEVSGDSHNMQSSNGVARPIQEEDWFHGVLPRDEVIRLLKDDGDYLVRESKNKKTGETQYVLSVMWTDSKHFIIQKIDNMWRFEQSNFSSIQELIRDQHSSGLPVTKKSQAILKRAILRESWELSNDDIKLGAKLGNGNFGDVFKGIFRGEEVAVKTCKETLSEDQKKKFIQEGRILKQYNHPNIVRFVGIAAQRQPVMIVMEYVAGGALLQFLRAENKKAVKKLQCRQLVKMCVDAAAGMSYLESNGCIHRDLAARNCLVGKDNGVKISDFGMSREEEEYTVSGGLKQIPIKWTAPEALNYGTYTSACDVWSFGILMWEIFSFGSTPYSGLTNNQARERVDDGYRMPAPDGTPDSVHNLMLKCWDGEPKNRLKFEEVHKELQSIAKKL